MVHDPYYSTLWTRNYVGTLPDFKQSFLSRECTRTSALIDVEFDKLWRSHLYDSPFDQESFRVIQPTAPSVDRAIRKWAQRDLVTITESMALYVESFLPDLKRFPRFVEIAETSPLDEETFKQGFRVWLGGMQQYAAPQRDITDADVKFTASSVAGPVYAANDIKTKGDGLKEIPVYSCSYADRAHLVPALYSVSGKEELIKRKKWESGDIRSFVPMPLDAHLEGMYQFSGIHIRMAELAQRHTSPIGVGWRQQHGGFIAEMRYRDQAKWNVDTDVEKWDSKFSKLFHWLEFGWHLKVAREYGYRSMGEFNDAQEALYYIFRDMAFNYVYNPIDKSVLLFDVGQPSGTTKTSYSNSAGHMFIQCYHWVKSRTKVDTIPKRYNWTEMLHDVTFKVYGDDNGTSVWVDELVPYYTLEALDETYRQFNLSVDKTKSFARRSVRPTETEPGMAWLGFRCSDDYYPVFDAEKALCSMLNPGKRLHPDQRVLKAVSLMVNTTFCERKVFDVIRDYAEKIVEDYEVTLPTFSFSSYSPIPTHEDCIQFWTGLEADLHPLLKEDGILDLFESLEYD